MHTSRRQHELAKWHSDQVRRLVTLSAVTFRQGAYPECFENIEQLTSEMMDKHEITKV